jgi:hypothetical protein
MTENVTIRLPEDNFSDGWLLEPMSRGPELVEGVSDVRRVSRVFEVVWWGFWPELAKDSGAFFFEFSGAGCRVFGR